MTETRCDFVLGTTYNPISESEDDVCCPDAAVLELDGGALCTIHAEESFAAAQARIAELEGLLRESLPDAAAPPRCVHCGAEGEPMYQLDGDPPYSICIYANNCGSRMLRKSWQRFRAALAPDVEK